MNSTSLSADEHQRSVSSENLAQLSKSQYNILLIKVVAVTTAGPAAAKKNID